MQWPWRSIQRNDRQDGCVATAVAGRSVRDRGSASVASLISLMHGNDPGLTCSSIARFTRLCACLTPWASLSCELVSIDQRQGPGNSVIQLNGLVDLR